VQATSDPLSQKHSHRLVLALAATSLLANAVVVAGVVLLFASGTARDWTASTLALATRDDLDPLEALEATAAAADARAGRALEVAGSGPTEEEIAAVQATVSDVDLRLSAVEATVADHEVGLDAGCDWAQLQQANFERTSLFNVFYDYTQSVCLNR